MNKLELYLYNMVILIMVFLILSTSCSAISWFASVDGWSIDRESQTVGFDMSSSINGNISAINVTSRSDGRPGYHSFYANINLNDVHLKERTSALEGHIESDDQVYLRSAAIEDVERTIDKPYGSTTYTFEYKELWPVIIFSKHALSYNGSEINDWEFTGNNLDFIGSSFLHSTQLSKARTRYLELKRMNITVAADETGVIRAAFLPTKTIGYFVDAKATGVTCLKYRQAAEDQISTLNEGNERFYGAFHLNASMLISSEHERNVCNNCWLAWCSTASKSSFKPS